MRTSELVYFGLAIPVIIDLVLLRIKGIPIDGRSVSRFNHGKDALD
jgi:hypothetical protein